MTALGKIITIAAFGAIITLLLSWFLIRPAWSAVFAASEQLKENQTTLLSLDQQLVALRAAQTDIKKAASAPEIAAWIVDRENLVLPVKEVEQAASRAGVIEMMDIQNPDPKDPSSEVVPGKHGIDEVHYRLNTSSDYQGVINFLSYLEHLPNWTEITKVNLSAEIKQGEAGKPSRTGKVLGTFDGLFFVNEINHVQN